MSRAYNQTCTVQNPLPLESPFVSGFAQQIAPGASRHAVDLIVGAHQAARLAFLDAAPKRRLEGVGHVLVSHLGIERVPVEGAPLLEVVRGVVLAAGGEHEGAVVALGLEAGDVLDGVGGGEGGVLAGGLLAAAPAGVAEDVDVWGPEGEAGLGGVVHGAGLEGDGAGEGAPEGAVEGGGGEDDLGELGGGGNGAGGEVDAGAVGGDAVEGLGPPLVVGEAEAGEGGGVVGEEGDLFGEGEEGEEGVGPGRDGEGGVAEWEGVEARWAAGV